MPRPEFQVHMLDETGLAKAKVLASMFSELLTAIEAIVPPGRERSLVATKLEEASYFAKKGMAVDPANHTGEVR